MSEESTAESDRSEHSIRARLEAARQKHRRLAGRLVDLAGDVAETEDSLAEQLTARAEHAPDRAEQLLAHAEEARRYAEKERLEQSRWRRVRDGEGRPDEDTNVAGSDS